MPADHPNQSPPDPPRPRRIPLRKRILFTIFVDLLALAAVAGIGEVACRLIAPQTAYEALPDWVLTMLQYSDDIYLGWELRPNELDHNSAGIRGREYSREKPPGVWRVAMIGDSVTYGLHVPSDETFAHLVENDCNAAGIGPVEVFNFGVPGYNPFQEYELLETRAIQYDPDLVVMTFTADDVETSPVIMNIGGQWALFRNHFEGSRLLNNPVHWSLFRHSHLYRFLYKSIVLGFAAPGKDFNEVYVRPLVEWENVRRVAELCRQRGITFLLVLSPYLLPYEPAGGDPEELLDMRRYEDAFDQIRQCARGEKVDFVDLEPLYRQYEGKLKIRPADHEHLNPLGHRLVAGLLSTKLATIKEARH